MELLLFFVGFLIVLGWLTLSLGVLAVGAYCLLRSISLHRRASIPRRLLVSAAGLALLGFGTLHNPVSISIAQAWQAAEMQAFHGLSVHEFEDRFGSPDTRISSFPTWYTLPWYSPFRFGTVTLVAHPNGTIGTISVRGNEAVFT